MFLTRSAGLFDPKGLARALSGLIQADCGLRTARTTDRIGCFQTYTSSARTSIVPTIGYTYRILRPCGQTPGRPLTGRMHLTTPSQEEDFVWTSHRVQVRTAFKASLTTEVVRYIAPCAAEDRCMNYITNYM